MFSLLLTLVASIAPATLTFTPSPAWQPKAVTSMMRIGEFVLPRAEGDAEDASLVVYFFGGTGGTVQANLDRWFGQLSQPDGRKTKDVATTTGRLINGLSVALFDASGTYVAEVTPGSPDRFNKPGFRMRAAVVQTSGGPYFIKLVGPAKSVTRWDKEFEAFLQTLQYK
ncbi:MAG: hypothetical protein ABIP90_03560 [Vicinamibacterales bacterium]